MISLRLWHRSEFSKAFFFRGSRSISQILLHHAIEKRTAWLGDCLGDYWETPFLYTPWLSMLMSALHLGAVLIQ